MCHNRTHAIAGNNWCALCWLTVSASTSITAPNVNATTGNIATINATTVNATTVNTVVGLASAFVARAMRAQRSA
jgi:hypothetical protein